MYTDVRVKWLTGGKKEELFCNVYAVSKHLLLDSSDFGSLE